MSSLLVRSTRALSDMPKWEQDEDNGQKDIMFLGDVKQKLPNIKWWMPIYTSSACTWARPSKARTVLFADADTWSQVTRSCGDP